MNPQNFMIFGTLYTT